MCVAIQIVRPLESIAETQPKLQPANEKTRHSQIAVALREMMNQLRIKHGRVTARFREPSARRFDNVPWYDEDLRRVLADSAVSYRHRRLR